MTSGEWAPDEREAVLGRLIMLTALGAVVFRVMAMGGGLALLWCCLLYTSDAADE